LLNDDVAGVNI